MRKILDSTKAVTQKAGDKMKLTAASRAPTEGDNFRELVADIKRYHVEVHDMEDKLKAYVASAKKLVAQGEGLAAAADVCCHTSGLSSDVNRIDLQPMKDVVDSFKERCDRVRTDITVIDEELKSLQNHIAERDKAGALYEKERKKAESMESKNDPKASVQRGEADRAHDNYKSIHSNTLRELQSWKSNAGNRLRPVYQEVAQVLNSVFLPGGSGGAAKVSTYSSPARTSEPAISSPVAVSSPVAATSPRYVAPEPEAVPDHYAPPPPKATTGGGGSASRITATAMWDFTGETPEEVTFKAGDTVFLLECVDGDEWWKGEVAGSGSVGLFPSAYVKKD